MKSSTDDVKSQNEVAGGEKPDGSRSVTGGEKRDLKGTARERIFTTKKIAWAGVFTALSAILYLFVKFPLPFLFPSFLEVNLSEYPALIGGFALGPFWGCAIIMLKTLIKLPFSSTACVGELSDLVNGLALVLVSSFFYKKHRTKKGAVGSLALGSLLSVVTSVFSNRFVMIPAYMRLFGIDIGVLTNMCSVIPNITTDNFYVFYILFAVVPFNILRCAVLSVVSMATYKKISVLLNRF